ncbi:MAG: hypothetical protein AAF646_02865 [Pseudomonadota bacterium]
MARKKKQKRARELMFVSGSATLTAGQERFISKYLDGRMAQLRSGLRTKIEARHAAVVAKLAQLEDLLSEFALLTTDKAQYALLSDLRKRRGDALVAIGVSGKGMKDTLRKLEAADATLSDLVRDAQGHRSAFLASTETDIDRAVSVKKLRIASQGVLGDLYTEWQGKVNELRGQLEEGAPGTAMDLPKEADLSAAFKAHRASIAGAAVDPSTDVNAAKSTFDGIIEAMRRDHARAIAAVDAFAAGAFQEGLARAKLIATVRDAMEGLAPLQTKLDTWDIPERAALNAEADALAERLDAIQSNGLSADALEKEASPLKTEILALEREMRAALIQANKDFLAVQAHLLEAQKTLQAKLDAMDKAAIPAEQRAPIETFLAATLTAISKLGGSNSDALRAAKAMVVEAREMVSQAQDIGTTNAEIKAYLRRAASALKPLSGKKSAVAAPAGELTEKVTAFAAEWLTKAPADALAEARALSSEALDLESQNTTLLRLRALMDKKIAAAEAKYTLFNDTFKRLLTWQGSDNVRDYRGPIRADLDGVKTWNATKTDIGFYSTISARLETISEGLDTRIEEMEDAMTSTPKDLADKALAAREAYETELEKLRQQAGSGKVDESALAAAKAEYEDALRKNAVHTDLSADLLEEERKEAVNIEKRQDFLTEAKAWMKQTVAAMKAAGKTDALSLHADEVKRQLTRLEATIKAATQDKTGPTGARGLAELKEITRVVDGIARRGSQTPKDKLGEIPAKWDKGAAAFSDGIGRLLHEVAAFEAKMEMPATASGSLRATLGEIEKRVAAAELQEPADVLGADPPEPAQARKAAREAALSEVRRLRKLVLDDPVVRACVANPFGVRDVATTTISQLEQIELDVLRGV